MNTTRLLTLIACSALVVSSGCTVGPDYVQPEIPSVPDTWNAEATSGLAEGEASLLIW